jgi:hypothetical protein
MIQYDISVRKYFRKYESTKVLSYYRKYFRKYLRTKVPFSTKVLPYFVPYLINKVLLL